MAKFINTTATNYHLEELIKAARERLVLISPYLQFNDRIKELLEDKDRMKIDVRIVYGKSELKPQEIAWLRSLNYVRTSFCQNLHAKCYMNENTAIVTSMNLYDFSQVNNNEMGVLIDREAEPDLYRDTYEEAQRLIRVSDEVRLSVEKVKATPAGAPEPAKEKPAKSGAPKREAGAGARKYEKLVTSRIAKARQLRTAELNARLVERGYLLKKADGFELTAAGIAAGGEPRVSKQYGPFFIWPKDIEV